MKTFISVYINIDPKQKACKYAALLPGEYGLKCHFFNLTFRMTEQNYCVFFAEVITFDMQGFNIKHNLVCNEGLLMMLNIRMRPFACCVVALYGN